MKNLLPKTTSFVWLFSWLCFIATNSYALSATTANSIQGTEPYLLLNLSKLKNINELLSFNMPDGSGGTKLIDISMTDALTAPETMKFNDISLLTPTVGDDDGDADATNSGTVSGAITATWYSGSISEENRISDSDLEQKLSTYGSSTYYLVVATKDIAANTTYGDPRIHTYSTGTNSFTYTFRVATTGSGVIYLKPQNDSIIGGYNNELFDLTIKGFLVNSGFPTTGFYKASFSLIGEGNDQSHYKCEFASDNVGDWVDLSTDAATSSLGFGCQITYKRIDRPTTAVKIKISSTENNGSSWTQIGTYTLSAPKLWAEAKSAQNYKTDPDLTSVNGIFPAANVCAGLTGSDIGTNVMTSANAAKYLFTRSELTNSTTEYFYRDIGTFMGEWGSVYAYTGSGFDVPSSNFVWTNEKASDNTQVAVTSSEGFILSVTPLATNILTVCKR